MKTYLTTPLLLLVTAISLLGCVTTTNSHLHTLDKGHIPRIGVISSIPNELSVEYIGATVFDNTSSTHTTTVNLNGTAERAANKLLKGSNKIEYISIDANDIQALQSQLPHKLYKTWQRGLNEKSLQIISKWGIKKDLEFLVLISPGEISTSHENSHGLTCIAGPIPNITMTGVYSAHVIDIEKANISYFTREISRLTSPAPTKELSPSDIQRIHDEWAMEQEHNDNTLIKSGSPELAVKYAKMLDGTDYTKLDQDTVDKIATDILPSFQQNIEKLLHKVKIL